MAATAPATTCSRPASSRSTRRPASGSGISRWCTTTCGTTTSRWPRTCSTSRSTARRRKIIAASTKIGWLYVLDRVTGRTHLADRRDAGGDRVKSRARSRRPHSRFRAGRRPYSQMGLLGVGPHRLHAGHQGLSAEAREEVPHGTVLHSRLTGRRQGKERSDAVHVLVVRAGSGRGREHRWRHGGRSRNGDGLRRRADRNERRSASRTTRARKSRTRRRTTAAASRVRCLRLQVIQPPQEGPSSPARSAGAQVPNSHRRRLDLQAQGARRHHRVRPQHRRQEVVAAERRDLAGPRADQRSALRGRDAAEDPEQQPASRRSSDQDVVDQRHWSQWRRRWTRRCSRRRRWRRARSRTAAAALRVGQGDREAGRALWRSRAQPARCR